MLDRDSSLKKAEKLVRQGRLDAAIAEYLKVVEDQPGDWVSANTLGDLYARAGRIDDAVAQYARIAEAFIRGGFLARAAALYKKILKVRREDDQAALQLAALAMRQGLATDARAHLTAVLARRRARGDRRGEAEVLVQLGAVDPADIDARVAAARGLEELGEAEPARAAYRALYEELCQRDRTAEARDVLRHLVRLAPGDIEPRRALARAALEAGDTAALRELLDRETAAGDVPLLHALVRSVAASGDNARIREAVPALLAADATARPGVIEIAWSVLDDHPAVALACVSACADAAVAAGRTGEAVDALRRYLQRVPGDIPALQKLIEVCIEAGLDREMTDAQAQLADACVAAGRAGEARVIAEDLVAREPHDDAHLARLRRALEAVGEPDPDAVIARRLSGDSPFTGLEWPPAPAAAAPTPMLQNAGRPASTVQAVDPAPPRRPDMHGEHDVDLTESLGGPVEPRTAAPPGEAAPVALDGVFQRIREAVQTAPDYSAQHLTLGRTYLEIGMVQEAISALRTAARSPRAVFEAASTLGRLYQQHHDTAEAIAWLERAAEAAPPGSAEGRALIYDFGVALESAGERARALAVFRQLASDGTDYRDIASRIERLGSDERGG